MAEETGGCMTFLNPTERELLKKRKEAKRGKAEGKVIGANSQDEEPGLRKMIPERFDAIPERAELWLARVMGYGLTARRGEDTWRETYRPKGNKSPLNHAMGHLAQARTMPVGSVERIWNLAKAMTNLAMQIWLEERTDREKIDYVWKNEIYPRALNKAESEWFEDEAQAAIQNLNQTSIKSSICEAFARR